ncbi:amidohydrolase family protein [Ferrovibrio terrae]|uniref:metal-dependent hydrolase family protein n=1 Tax=Ferrovibrio terrae TaxID=2594003 RepID=UPI003137E40F
MTSILFSDASLFDGETPQLKPGMHVLIEGDRIKEVSDKPIAKPAGAQEIKLNGKALLPGLIDAHFHAVLVEANLAKLGGMPKSLLGQHARAMLEAAMQRGFTTVRDAGGADYGLAMATEVGLIAGPRLFYAGRVLSPTGGHGDSRGLEEASCACCSNAGAFSHIADGVDEVRKAAREELRRGATQIKIMASGGVASPSDPIYVLQYSEEEIRTAVWEAQSWRRYVMAHAYTPEAIRRASAFGVRTIEHANLIDEPTAQFCAEQGTYVVPTLVTYDALDKYGRAQGLPEVSIQKLKVVREAGLKSLEILKRAKTKVGFGTDLIGGMHPHQSGEFVIRANVLSPFEILRSATVVNAEILQMEGELGCIKSGALADVIVVDGDPLKDIALLDGQGERIPIIMKGGKFYKSVN